MTKAKLTNAAAFAPELLAVMVKGSMEEVRIPLREKRIAIALRARLHHMRSIMRKTKHAYASVVERAKVTIEEYPDKIEVTLIIRPSDNDYIAAIRAAGVDPKELLDPADYELPVVDADADALHDFHDEQSAHTAESAAHTTHEPAGPAIPQAAADFFAMLKKKS